VSGEITGIVDGTKGWLTCSIATYSPAFILAVPRGHGRWLPIVTSNDKGIRNFTEAANQSQ
jgi:hypothetical protein